MGVRSDRLGVVFAGGRSERMGRDKAALPWPDGEGGETTLLERAGRVLERLCLRVEIAEGERGRVGEAPWPSFPDVVAGEGPLAGLLAALERAHEARLVGVLALACDMPLVGVEELRSLVEAAASRGPRAPAPDAAMWVVDGRDQPLCAFYRTTCLGAARRAFSAGARRPVAIFEDDAADGRPLCLERIRAGEKSARRLVNVNTATDYDRALREASIGR